MFSYIGQLPREGEIDRRESPSCLFTIGPIVFKRQVGFTTFKRGVLHNTIPESSAPVFARSPHQAGWLKSTAGLRDNFSLSTIRAWKQLRASFLPDPPENMLTNSQCLVSIFWTWLSPLSYSFLSVFINDLSLLPDQFSSESTPCSLQMLNPKHETWDYSFYLKVLGEAHSNPLRSKHLPCLSFLLMENIR